MSKLAVKLLLNIMMKVFLFDVKKYRDFWYKTSTLIDKKQTSNNLAEIRYNNYKKQP